MLHLLALLNATQTGSNNFWNVNITDCIIAGSAAIALIFGVITATKWQKKQTQVADKQYQLNAFLEIFKMINAEDQINARRTLDAYKNEPYNREFYQQQFGIVRTTFDMMGMLYNQNAIPREMLLENYWYITIQCWNNLLPFIEDIRTNAELPLYARPFEVLKDAALEFHKKHYPTQRLPAFKDTPL